MQNAIPAALVFMLLSSGVDFAKQRQNGPEKLKIQNPEILLFFGGGLAWGRDYAVLVFHPPRPKGEPELDQSVWTFLPLRPAKQRQRNH